MRSPQKTTLRHWLSVAAPSTADRSRIPEASSGNVTSTRRQPSLCGVTLGWRPQASTRMWFTSKIVQVHDGMTTQRLNDQVLLVLNRLKLFRKKPYLGAPWARHVFRSPPVTHRVGAISRCTREKRDRSPFVASTWSLEWLQCNDERKVRKRKPGKHVH